MLFTRAAGEFAHTLSKDGLQVPVDPLQLLLLARGSARVAHVHRRPEEIFTEAFANYAGSIFAVDDPKMTRDRVAVV